MLLKWFAWHINSEFVPFNHLVKSALLEPIEPMILQSSHCEKSEQEAATVFEIRQRTREVNPFIPTLRMVTHWLMVHSDSSSTQATIVSSSLSEEVSNMAMLMPLSNTLIVVMIFRAWVSPWVWWSLGTTRRDPGSVMLTGVNIVQLDYLFHIKGLSVWSLIATQRLKEIFGKRPDMQIWIFGDFYLPLVSDGKHRYDMIWTLLL